MESQDRGMSGRSRDGYKVTLLTTRHFISILTDKSSNEYVTMF